MIHVFHGFLGSPADFSFLDREGVLLHDLTKPLDVHPTTEDILIGYSMGGRIAIELAASVNFQVKKLVLLSAHPGLTDSEKEERTVFENDVLKKIATYGYEEFMSWWNGLSIFRCDGPITVSEERFMKSKSLFEKHLLSNQKDYTSQLRLNASKVLYLVGTEDKKYMELASEKLLPLNIRVRTLKAGHRLFQNSTELKSILMEEGIL